MKTKTTKCTGSKRFTFSISGTRDSKFSALGVSMVERWVCWGFGERNCGNFPLRLPAISMSSAKCPSCGMVFRDETSVLKHMNHRFSSCKFFFLHGNSLPTHPSTPPLTPPNPPSRSMVFPGAGHVYGRGNGYMGTFHEDTHAPERTSNPYYPFLSKGEWEIASFLSKSGLSMKHIDEFLSLSLVRLWSSDVLGCNLSLLILQPDFWTWPLIPLCQNATWPDRIASEWSSLEINSCIPSRVLYKRPTCAVLPRSPRLSRIHPQEPPFLGAHPIRSKSRI